jgi:DNA-binding transcriptional MerR regulator
MTISEVCKQCGLSADTLRYYEKIGLLPKIGRTDGGIRNYTENDCKWIEFIKCMRGAGMSVESLTLYLHYIEQGGDTVGDRKQILIEERKRIAEKVDEMQTALNRLDSKIEHYESYVMPAEKLLVK